MQRGAMGHITPACGHRQNAQLAQHVQLPSFLPTKSQPPQQLAIAYDGGSCFPADGLRPLGPFLLLLLLLYPPLPVLARSTLFPIGLLQRCLCD